MDPRTSPGSKKMHQEASTGQLHALKLDEVNIYNKLFSILKKYSASPLQTNALDFLQLTHHLGPCPLLQ